MKIKFTRAFVATVVCLIVFLVTTLIPSLRDFKTGDFLQGFSGGAGLVTLIASVHYYLAGRKEQNASDLT
jgi:hypothetical protein